MMKHVEITNKGGHILRGYLTMPENFCHTLVVFYHGFTGNKTEHNGYFRDLARLLEKDGLASLRMDFYGNGESDGTFADFTFDTMYSDAEMMLDYGRNLPGVKKIVVLGYSMGGNVAGQMCARHPDLIDGAILWSPGGTIAEHIAYDFEISPKLENGNANHRNFEISMAMYESTSRYKNSYEGVEKFTKPVLVIHGRADQVVNYLLGARYAETFPDAQLHIIDGAGHGYDQLSEHAELFKITLDYLKGGFIR